MYERAAVFLDLQGTLGGEGLGDIKHFTFFPSAIPAIKLLNDANLLAIVVTNQSHIAKGFFTFEYFSERMEVLKNELYEGGARLDAVYCCPHETQDNCSCEKPKPGMLVAAPNSINACLISDKRISSSCLRCRIPSTRVLLRYPSRRLRWSVS
jgi:D-glycero-D-manno-heptose 1,7-bisphosphate phosphatase